MANETKRAPGGYIVALIVPADTRVCAGPVRIVWPDGRTTTAEVHSAHFETPDTFSRRMEAHDEALTALADLLSEVEGLMGESDGVAGLHSNGDLAPWSELDAGGRYERLSSLPAARAAIARATGEEATS